MTRIRIIVPAIVAAFAFSAVGAASAWAAHNGEFKAEKYKVKVHAKKTNLHGFKAAGLITLCEEATFTGEAGGPSHELEVHPVYEKCFAGLAKVKYKVEVETTNCNYKFHDPELLMEPSVDVVCTGTPKAQVHVKLKEEVGGGLFCEVLVPEQAGLKKVEYNNLAGPPKKVEVEANVKGIKYTSNCPGVNETTGGPAEYKEGVFGAGGLPELTANPAKALAEGKWLNEFSEEVADGISA
jgi:hypothetical protein